MKKLHMKKRRIIAGPTKIDYLTFEDYEEGDREWRQKARELQIRRWQHLNHQFKAA